MFELKKIWKILLVKHIDQEQYHSHKKRKDSLEGSLERVILAAVLKFPKMLVPRLSQNTLDVSIKCAKKSKWLKQLYSLYVTSLLER